MHLLARVGLGLLLFIALCLTLVPMVWLVASCLKNDEDQFHYLFFSPHPSLRNFSKLFGQIHFARYVMNSMFVASTTVLTQLVISTMAGFALARYQFAGKKFITLLFLSVLLIPAQVLMVPLYELLYHLGLLDSYPGLIIPWGCSVLGIFLFRQTMVQIPNDLIYSARIDGCTEFGVFHEIAIPMVRPMVGAFSMIAFMAAWNNFLWPQIILQTEGKFTLPIALSQMVGLYSHDYGTLMAGTVLSIVPVALYFLLVQKDFIAGLTSGALKG